MSSEVKNLIQILVWFVPIMAGLFIWILNSPMYQANYEVNRQRAIAYLSATYYFDPRFVNDDLVKMKAYYKITDDEINPSKVLGIYEGN